MFDKILCDDNAVIHTKAVESFTQFAESTPHETLVPECIGSKPFLQDIVVAYLNKVGLVFIFSILDWHCVKYLQSACMKWEDSDQPAHRCSLIRAFPFGIHKL